MLTLLLAAPSFATPRNVKFCAEVDIEYLDIGPSVVSGDRWTDDTNKPARGFKYTVRDVGNNAVRSTGYLGAGPANTGCVTVSLNSGSVNRVEYQSIGQVAGNIVGAYTNVSYATWNSPNYAVTVDATVVHTLPGTTEDRWNHLALATFALSMYDLGVTGKTFTLQEATTGLGSGDTSEAANRVDVSDFASKNYKYRAGWELGRLMTMYRDGGGTECASATASAGYCDGNRTLASGFEADHGYLKMMYMSRAGCDGTADFYNSLVWNQLTTSQTDCAYRPDYPLDDSLGNDNGITGWEYLPGDLPAYVCNQSGYRDWLNWAATTPDGFEDCVGPIDNRSTRDAWLQFYWQMAVTEGVPVNSLWDLWDATNAHSWCVDDSCSIVSPNRPSQRLFDAATSVGYFSQYYNARNEGVYR